MSITKEEAIRLLGRYDNEYYTPATREAHRMGIAALNRVEELEKELADERHRHDRYVDFELAEAEELRKLKEERRWIPVTEPPKESGDYLARCHHHRNGDWCEVVPFDADKGCFVDLGKHYYPYVTGWMPLPEPPKEVE